MQDTTSNEPHLILSPSVRRKSTVLLLLIGIVNVIDRNVINILAEPIKLELGLLDWQLGVLTGLTFAIFYTGLGLPVAQLAERTSRSAVITGCLVVWSLFTLLSGMAQNFLHLCLARIGVAAGEAGCTPAAHSLLSDYYPIEKRASAMAFYALATPFGAFLGLMIGGIIADSWGWRIAFITVAIPGFVLALFTIGILAEPRKLQAKQPVKTDLKEDSAQNTVSIRDAVASIAGKKTFWLVSFAGAVKAFIGYGHAPFTASFFFRNHTAEISRLGEQIGLEATGFLGLCLGLIAGGGGALGTWLGGAISDRYAARDMRIWVVVPAIASLVTPILFTAALLQPSAIVALLLLSVNAIFSAMWLGPVFATAQSVAPPRTRALASALILFVISLIGLGLGPLTVGALSDWLAIGKGYGTAEGLRWALIYSSLIGFVSFPLFWYARKFIREDIVND